MRISLESAQENGRLLAISGIYAKLGIETDCRMNPFFL